MKFKVIASERALKDLKKLSKTEKKRIYEELEKLENPFELDIKKLKKNIYGVRVGDLESLSRSILIIKSFGSPKSTRGKEFTIAYSSLSSLNNIDLMK